MTDAPSTYISGTDLDDVKRRAQQEVAKNQAKEWEPFRVSYTNEEGKHVCRISYWKDEE